jgi:hypothetical protein
MAQSLREKYIDTILKNKYGDQKHNNTNRAFLETLTLDELARLADYQDEMEDEFDLDGEIRDIDFDENELY